MSNTNISYQRNPDMEIKIFGDKAKEIQTGQIFIATKGSVEGRDVVTLELIR